MSNYGNNDISLELFITADVSATATVRGQSFSEEYAVAPNEITSVTVPDDVMALSADGVEDGGIRVFADTEFVVYGLNQEHETTDAFLGLPTAFLGTEYIVLAYTARALVGEENEKFPAGGRSQFMIVANEDDTVVIITPSLDTGSRRVGVPYNITLDALQTYQLQSDGDDEDVTGTRIVSTKPIAVFGGGVCLNVPSDKGQCDHLVEQLPPSDAWGQDFLTVPLATRTAGDVFRILARDDNTMVAIDGTVVAGLNSTEFYETDLASTDFHEITTTRPALVAQYSKGKLVDDVEDSDPFMMLIPPAEQFLSSYTLTTPTSGGFTNYINVVVLAGEYEQCTLDGAAMSDSELDPPSAISDSGWNGVQLSVTIGTHNLACPSSFGAYAYGFADFDSYGYPAGMALGAIVS